MDLTHRPFTHYFQHLLQKPKPETDLRLAPIDTVIGRELHYDVAISDYHLAVQTLSSLRRLLFL